MKPRKSTIFIALLALLLALFAIGMGQGTTQTDQKKQAESCCVEGSACCAEGACKHEGESCCKEGAECCKEGAECCKKHESCCGESCDLAKHDAKAKHDPSKHANGACCKMKQKDAKNKTKAKA